MSILRAMIICLTLAAPGRAASVSVAVAISLKEAVGDIAAAYEAETGDEVRFTFGSSGQLMAQIRNGAPVDAFVSAADKQIDELIEAGQLDKATRRVIAGNALVLIVPADAGDSAPTAFADLADPKHRRVAIGEPKTVPAGQYAMQVLTKLDVAKSIGDGRLVYGANVRQVLDYVVRGEVSAGVVYATDAKEAGEKVRVVATADAATHDPIVYPAAVVTASRKRGAAARFLDFLGGEEARTIFAERGFTIPESEADGESPRNPAGGKADEQHPTSRALDPRDDAQNPSNDQQRPADEPAPREPVAR